MNPVEEYLVNQGMVKEALNPGAWTPGQQLAATAITGVATPLALMAAHEGYQEVKGMVGRARGYKKMMDFNPKLKKMDSKKTKALFNTLHNAAPDLARDPVVASSWVNRMAYQDEYVDPRTLADLGTAQQKIQRKGLELPVGQITSGMMSSVGDMPNQQRQAEMLSLNYKKFEHQKAQDAVTMAKNKATMKKDIAQARRERMVAAKTKLELRKEMKKRREGKGDWAPPEAPAPFQPEVPDMSGLVQAQQARPKRGVDPDALRRIQAAGSAQPTSGVGAVMRAGPPKTPPGLDPDAVRRLQAIGSAARERSGK